MVVLPVYLSVHHVHEVPVETRRGMRIEVTDGTHTVLISKIGSLKGSYISILIYINTPNPHTVTKTH